MRDPIAVTDRTLEELLRLRARHLKAEQVLRDTHDPWKALRAAGISATGTGRRGYSAAELTRLANLYANMISAPEPPYRPRYARTPERLDGLLAYAADTIAAQREGRKAPPDPDELYFVPDVDVPMDREAALRNVMRFAGLARATTWNRLRSAGVPRADLPPRDGPRTVRKRSVIRPG